MRFNWLLFFFIAFICVTALLFYLTSIPCEKYNCKECSRSNEMIDFQVRKFEHAYSFNESEYVTELDSKYIYSNVTVDPSKTALILVDVWDRNTTYNKGFYDRSIRTTENISRVLNFSREHGISVVRSYNFYNPYFAVEETDFVVDARNIIPDENELNVFLTCRGIDTILYAGYATNMCVLFNPTGMIEMHNIGYKTYILRDCTLALETPETYENEYILYSSLTIIETQFEGSILSSDLIGDT